MEGWRRKVLVSRSTRIDDPRRSPIDHDGVAEVPVVMLKRQGGTSYLTVLPSFRFMFKAFITLLVGRFRSAVQ